MRVIIGERVGRGFVEQDVISVQPGEFLSFGREAALRVGADPPDQRVSRVAVEVRPEPDGWSVAVRNRNGALVHPWALPAWPARAQERLSDLQVGLRIEGSGGRWHWILLERDAAAGQVHKQSGADTVLTELGSLIRPLTSAQEEVLRAVFADLLAWPPVIPAQTLQLKQVARRLGVSESAVQARLAEVRTKAQGLGLARQVSLTDPEYVHILVRAGYLTPAEDAGC